MDLNELQSVKSRERQTAELQQLRSSFYEEVGTYLRQLEDERDRVARQADDPFSNPEVQRLTDDIETAKGTVESLYERRIGKLVKQASLEAAGMGADTDGLTREERDAFERIVTTIEANRERVLDGVVAGEDVPDGASSSGGGDPSAGDADPARQSPPDASDTEADRDRDDARGRTAKPESGSRSPVADRSARDSVSGDAAPGVSAADLMGDGPSTDGGEPSRSGPNSPASASGGAADADRHDGHRTSADDGTAEGTERGQGTDPGDGVETGNPIDASAGSEPSGSAREESRRDPGGEATSADGPGVGSTTDDPDAVDVERTMVRITRDVGRILGVDERPYDLAAEDVVTLPEPNARPLLDRNAAEQL